MDKFSLYLQNIDDTNDESDDSGTIYELEIQSDLSSEDESVEVINEILPAVKDENVEIVEIDDLIPPCEDDVKIKEEDVKLSDCKPLSIKTEDVWTDDACDNEYFVILEIDDLIPPCEDDVKIKEEDEKLSDCISLSIKTEEVGTDDGCDNEDFEVLEIDVLIPPCDDNVKIKEEGEMLSDYKSLSIKTKEVWIGDGCDNDDNSSDTDRGDNYSQMETSTASNSNHEYSIFGKKTKVLPEYLHINSEEKNLNIALLQSFKQKQYLWNANQRKCRKEYNFQKGYESIATEINAKFSRNLSWIRVKNRINEMRSICAGEMLKELNGEKFKMPWFFEYMDYLKSNLRALATQRKRDKIKRTKKVDESILPIFIELYEKYEELWQVNNIYFHIPSKRPEIYNKMLKELKSDYNIKFGIKNLNDYLKYIHRVFSENKEKELKSELDKSDFSPTSKHYKKLTFLKDSQGPFKCPHCNDFIQKFENYHLHVAEHTDTLPFKCLLCEAQFKNYISYIYHLQYHVDLKNGINRRKNKHRNIIKNRNSYQCDICNKYFDMKTLLYKHKLSHKYQCQICFTSFRCSSVYDEHIRSHGIGEDNVQINEENKKLNDYEILSISPEEASCNDGYDSGNNTSDSDMDESCSQMELSTPSSVKNANFFKKRSKYVPDYLLISSKEKEINIAILRLFKKKPHIWNTTLRKCKKGNKFQKEYESIATFINAKFSVNVSWEFVKNRINEMFFICCDEMKKQARGKQFKMPWFFEHMKYLKANFKTVVKDRVKYQRSKKIDKKSTLLSVIELYEKQEELWHVNNVYFGIFSKKKKIYNRMLEKLNSDYNKKITPKQLKYYIKHIHLIFSKDRKREIKCELDKSNFSPEFKHYEKLTFLKDSRGPFKCPHCNDIIQKFETYHRHVAEHTNAIPFRCLFCENPYQNYDRYIRHIKKHISINKSSNRCDICYIAFKSKSTYDKHTRRHENGFRFECHICKEDFDQLRLLDNHIKTHLNGRNFLCNICGKEFITYSTFRYHKAVYGNTKHYRCKICGKICANEEYFDYHLIQNHPIQYKLKEKSFLIN